MPYIVSGLDGAAFSGMFALNDDQLAAINARRVTATAKPGFPCRITLEDAEVGEQLILLNHVSHDVATPYRSAYAIYVRHSDAAAARYVDELPPVFIGRPIALRGFDATGMLRRAALAQQGEADHAITTLLADDEIAYIHAHNAAHGCYAARIDRI